MQTMITEEQKRALGDVNNRIGAAALVDGIGVRSDTVGGVCLVYAVILCGMELCESLGDIYDAIGQYNDTLSKSITRAVANAIERGDGVAVKLSDMLGVTIPSAHIHNGLVIAYLGALFRNPLLNRIKKEA